MQWKKNLYIRWKFYTKKQFVLREIGEFTDATSTFPISLLRHLGIKIPKHKERLVKVFLTKRKVKGDCHRLDYVGPTASWFLAGHNDYKLAGTQIKLSLCEEELSEAFDIIDGHDPISTFWFRIKVGKIVKKACDEHP